MPRMPGGGPQPPAMTLGRLSGRPEVGRIADRIATVAPWVVQWGGLGPTAPCRTDRRQRRYCMGSAPVRRPHRHATSASGTPGYALPLTLLCSAGPQLPRGVAQSARTGPRPFKLVQTRRTGRRARAWARGHSVTRSADYPLLTRPLACSPSHAAPRSPGGTATRRATRTPRAPATGGPGTRIYRHVRAGPRR